MHRHMHAHTNSRANLSYAAGVSLKVPDSHNSHTL